MPYLIFDTESSGLFDFKKPADAPGQPRMAAFAGILIDDDLVDIESHIALIKPAGWVMQDEATAINGLTTERLMDEGMPISQTLEWYGDHVKAGAVVSAYNSQHDCKIMRAEFRRLMLPDLFEITKNICLMRSAHKLGIEKAGDKKRGFPKLSDTYRHLFGEEMQDAHQVGADALAALRIFRKMHGAGQLLPAEVHYAKNPPIPETPPAI